MNPAHLDATFAATDLFGHIVAHGMWTGALVSAVLGTKLPGPGTICLAQDLKFLKPAAPGDTITTTVTVKEKRSEKHIVLLDTVCTNQRGDQVLTGTATVIAPERTIVWPRTKLPDVSLRRHERYEAFVKGARSLPAISAAIVHPGGFANWKPSEIFLYDWWPLARRRDLYRRLSDASIELRSAAP